MEKCKECGAVLPCVNSERICKECDEQFQYCYDKCKAPCREKAEQKRMFDRVKKGWNADL